MSRFKRHVLVLAATAVLASAVSVVTASSAPAAAAGPPIASLPTDNPANFTPNVLDGKIDSIWQFGNTVVVGGTFTEIANSTSNGGAVFDQAYLAAFNATTGQVIPAFDPVLDSAVEVIIPSATAGSFYIGGDFTTVDGTNRRKVARLNLADGSLVGAFNIGGVNGLVRDLRLVGGTLYVGGLFTTMGPSQSPRTYLASVDANTGALTTKLNLPLAGLHNGGTGKVIKMEVTPDGSRMLITGNFTSIDGQPRGQVALIDLSTTPATLSDWRTDFYTTTCASAFDSYTRDLDISDDGGYAIISTTGAYRANMSCDTVARLELGSEQAGITPTWVSYTGGDTSYAVEIHDGVAYIGGHMRWFNNPFSADRQGAGGVARPGMGALDVVTGIPYSWNPTRDRGVGLFDYHVTAQGIWAGSDTNRFNQELRQKLAFFPWSGGVTVPGNTIGVLPGDVFQLGRTAGSTGNVDQSVLFRVNAGGPALTSADDGPNWEADTATTSPYRNTGSGTSTAPTNQSVGSGAAARATPQNDSSVPRGDLDRPPAHLWTTERYDPAGGNEMQWNFPVANGIPVTVRLYLSNRCNCTDNTGDRVFDVRLENSVVLNDLDLSQTPGHDIGTMETFDITSDGNIDIDFLHGVADNPIVNGIEIIRRNVTPTGTLGVQDEVVRRTWSGSGAATQTTLPGTVPWRTVRGAFLVNATLFTLHADGTLMRRTFDGTTFGPGTAVNGWANTLMADMVNMTGIFFDPATSRIYYTIAGQNSLYYRAFVPETGIAHAVRSTAGGAVDQLDPIRVNGMFLDGGRLHFADTSAGGDLRSIAWANGAPTGTDMLEEGARDWRGRALFLSLGAAANDDPTADIATPVACAVNVCEFDGTGSTDGDGTIVSYEWDFGDGSLVGTGGTPTHTYTEAGVYTVTLTVTDDLGGVDTDQVDVSVSDPSNSGPIANPTATCAANVCEFDGTGSTDADGTIESFLWFFGDGTTGAGATPTHAYAAAGTYTVELTVTDDAGATATDSLTVTVTAPPPSAGDDPMVPLVPARLLETRKGTNDKTVDGEFEGIGVRRVGSTLELQVTGRGGVPGSADAVMLNVTAVLPEAPGYLTVFPCGDDRPLASSVNYAAGQVVPNAVLAKIGTGGKVCIYTLARTHLIVDVNGYVPDGGSPATVAPARLLETRIGPNEKTVDGDFEGIGVRRAGSTLQLTVTGRGGVPANADAVMLNVTAVFPDAPGYLTVFPCGEERPLASNVNYQAGQVVPNAVLAKIGTGGKVCIYTLARTDLIVDVNGYVPDGASPETVVPARLLETRVGRNEMTIDGEFEGIGVRRADSTLELTVAGRGGVPANADAVMLNVTAVFPDAPGYLTVFPCGEERPLASNVNYQAGQVVPNAVLAKIGTGGKVCIYTLAETHLIVDVVGYT